MRAKRRGQSKPAAGRRIRRQAARGQKSDPSSPDSVISTNSRRSSSKAKNTSSNSSPSEIETIVSPRRSGSQNKPSGKDRSCSVSPLNMDGAKTSTPRRTSSKKKTPPKVFNEGPIEKHASNISEEKLSDSQPGGTANFQGPVPVVEPSATQDSQVNSNNLGTKPTSTKSIIESNADGRRASTRQRKPSWRVNSELSDVPEDKTQSKPASPTKSSKLQILVVPGDMKILAKRLKLDNALSDSETSTTSTSVPNGDAQPLLVPNEKDENRGAKDSARKTSTEEFSALTNGIKSPAGSIYKAETSINGKKSLIVEKAEIIDLVDDAEPENRLKISYSNKAGFCSLRQKRVAHECCCTEATTSELDLRMDTESAETYANDCFTDMEGMHLPIEWYCQAVDLVGPDKIGCYRVSSDDLILYRVSKRCPFRLLCAHHLGRLKLHQCCPICGYFCTHGSGIMLCTGNMDSARSSTGDIEGVEPKWTSHLFHKACAMEELSLVEDLHNGDTKVDTSVDLKSEGLSSIACPHCGEDGDIKEISLTLRATLPVTIPHRPLVTRKMTVAGCRNSSYVPLPEDNTLRYVEESTAASLCQANDEVKILLSEDMVSLDTKSFLKYLLKDDLPRVLAVICQNKSVVNARFKSREGQYPLHLAVSNKNICLLHGLIVAGANPDAVDNNYVTPLMLAAKLNEPTLAKYLIAAGANKYHKDPNGMNVVHMSAAAGNLMVLQGILEDHVELLKSVDNKGMTALMHAAKNSRTEVVNYLASFWPLETNVRAVDCDKNTPLHWAAASGAVQAVSTLLKHGADVNAKNNLDQTPLHWAVLHGRDGSVLTLLVNQAEISMTDVTGKTPLDLCTEDCGKQSLLREVGDNWNSNSLHSIKKTIKECMVQTLALRSRISLQDKKSAYRVVSKDVSRGQESHNVLQCVNSVDDENLPGNFKYITTSVFSCKSIAQPDRGISETRCCSCSSNPMNDVVSTNNNGREDDEKAHSGQDMPVCFLKSCSCSEQSHYVRERLFSQNEEKPVKIPYIQECNQLCGCDARLCCNRVVQLGSKCELQIFRTKRKGWGVKTLGRIPRGSFVCTYVGEIIDSVEASRRLTKHGDSYLFDLYGGQLLLDSTEFGNVARFINHSCSPNVVPIKVLIEHQDKRFPHIAFFAKMDIEAGDEICFDYGPKYWITKTKEEINCMCHSEHCSYRREGEDDDDVYNGEDDDVFSSCSEDAIMEDDHLEEPSRL